MKNLPTLISRSNLTARERFLTLIKNDVHKAKTGEAILSEADEYALEHWESKDNFEAQEWNTLNDGWKLSGRMDLEIEIIFKEAQVAYLAQLPFIMELLSYPADQNMAGAMKTMKSIKKVTIEEAVEITKKQREVKLKDGMDLDYAIYQLAFELLTAEDQERLKELYEEVAYDHQYLDQEEVLANLFEGKEELTQKAKEKLAKLVAEKSYNHFAKEHQLYHYFACIPLLQIAKYFLKSKGVEVEIKKDEDGLYESDKVEKAMEAYAKEHGTSIKEMLRKACLAALDSGLLDDYTPLVVSDDADLFNRWLETKDKAGKVLKKHIDAGELKIRNRTDSETRKEKLYSKKLYDGELELAQQVMENIGLATDLKGEADERVAFTTFNDLVLTGESLYEFKGEYEFVKEFKERVDKYNPNLGIVYADDDPEQKGEHLDQELLICDFDKNGEARWLSRYGMAVTMLSNIMEAKMYFKEVKDNGKTYLEFKDPAYEAILMVRRQDLTNYYAQLLAFEEIFKKLDNVYEADLSHHVLGRIKSVKEFIEHTNKAVQIATNTQEGDLEKSGRGPFRRKDKLYLREELIIDVEAIQPDRNEVQKHVEKLKGIFRGF